MILRSLATAFLAPLFVVASLFTASATTTQSVQECLEGNKLTVIEQEINKLPDEATVKRITDKMLVDALMNVMVSKFGPPPFEISTITQIISIDYPNGATLILFIAGDCNRSAVTVPTGVARSILTDAAI